MKTIDGSHKSGSGTFVRDVIPFCALAGEPVRIVNIRAKREKPGLRPQHLKAIEAATQMCGGKLSGAYVGSGEVHFTPGKNISGGFYRWDIGTAGSACLLALCILPLALYADNRCEFDITGGLFQDYAPPAFHLKYVLLPLLGRMGIHIDLNILQPGYVPGGKGRMRMTVSPLKQPAKAINLDRQGDIIAIEGISLSSHLRERKVSSRMASACTNELIPKGYSPSITIKHDTRSHPAFQNPAIQPGAALAIRAHSSTRCIIGADMAGARGRPAEQIGRTTAQRLMEDIDSNATVDRFTGDQLIPFVALASGQSCFRIPAFTEHVDSRLWLISTILGASHGYSLKTLTVNGISYVRR